MIFKALARYYNKINNFYTLKSKLFTNKQESTADNINFSIQWPSYFTQTNELEKQEPEYVIRWPEYYVNCPNLLIQWPNYFNKTNVLEEKKEPEYCINWPNYFQKFDFIEKKESEFCISWPDFFMNKKKSTTDNINFSIQWPSYFNTNKVLEKQETEYCISWPNFIIDTKTDIKHVELLINFPNYFQQKCKTKAENEVPFIIKWPNFTELKAQSHKPIEKIPIKWPEFISADTRKRLESTPKPARKQYQEPERRYQNRTDYTPIYTKTHTRSYYDHSNNLSGLQYVSGHYRRLANGKVIYVKGHTRYRR